MFTNEAISSFNELEYSLYDYICKNGEKVVYMRIRDLANQTHVSTSTILRFCRKLNCEGFSEFKVKLKMHLEKSANENFKSVQYALSEFVERIARGSFESYIEDSAKLIAEAENVVFIGAGSSGILAEYGARYLSSLDKFSLHINDPFFPINAHYLHNSVTIVLSVSGETPNIIDQVNTLKREGSKIISITNNKNCTIAKISDINIPYYVTEEYKGLANITTQIPVIYLLESIARTTYKLMNS
ncbi:MAG: MurR/RpiR family transcriptional regulator [Ectobacillus sp.]